MPGGPTTVTVPIELDSQGDESSASFTVNFNPMVFSNPVVVLGTGVPTGSVLGTNTNDVALGRLGILVDSTNTYALGNGRQIVRITFNVVPGTLPGTYPNSFSSTPTPQSVSSAQGVLLTTTYETGNVVIGVTAASVTISGRVTTLDGRGLRNATVSITDSLGVRRTATTSSFGLYSFDNVPAGDTYVIGVSSKRYRFAPQTIQINNTLTDVNFVGLE